MFFKRPLVQIAFFLIASLAINGCADRYQSGQVFSVTDGAGRITMVKIVRTEPDVLYLRVYGVRGDTSVLSGAGNIPVNRKDFEAWHPEPLDESLVFSSGQSDIQHKLQSEVQ